MTVTLAHADLNAVQARLSLWTRRAPWMGAAWALFVGSPSNSFPTYLLNGIGALVLAMAFIRRDQQGIDQFANFYCRHRSDLRVKAIFWMLLGRCGAGMFFVGFCMYAAANISHLGAVWSYAILSPALLYVSFRAECRAKQLFNIAG